jgi:TRAP transporter TAXI family solute receptor
VILHCPSSLLRRARPLSAFIVFAACGGACQSRPAPAAPEPLTILTGGTGGSFYPLGEALAGLYTQKIPSIRMTAQSTVASVFNVQALQQGKADVAFTQGDVAYFAYRRGTEADPRPHTKLRGIAVLWVNTVQLVVPRTSEIRQVRDLRDKRVGVGSTDSGTQIVARLVIEGHGMKYAQVKSEALSFADAVQRMEKNSLDAGFVVASYPVSAVSAMNSTVGMRLIPVEPKIVDRIRSDYPFVKPMLIPAGTYTGQDRNLDTLGVDNILVCREDLSEDLVYQLTKVLFESLSTLTGSDPAARLIDPEQGPTTPIPLHPGAARFYREREILR